MTKTELFLKLANPDENYTKDLGCVGCYQYDPVKYRKKSALRIAKEAVENTVAFIMKKLYGDDEE